MVLTIVELSFKFYVLPLINSKNNINSKTTLELLHWHMKFDALEKRNAKLFSYNLDASGSRSETSGKF